MLSEFDAVAILFTDIQGSTLLWEREPARMRHALARHDALTRTAVEGHRGKVLKMTGDGACALFADPRDAVAAALTLQLALADPAATDGLALPLRCGMHVGSVERRDDDVFGGAVNRAARIMAAAHGGQMLISKAAAEAIGNRWPDGVSMTDLGTVRLRDLASPEHIFQIRHPGLRATFPALRSLESTPNNLPELVASFVGRDRESAEVRRLLASCRLLTLSGVGGIGKTRLSLQVASEMMDDFADGIWLVELAAHADGQDVPQAVASVLGVQPQTGETVQDALIAHVKDRQLLILLDNCEHLVQACADIAKRLLQSGPGVRILVTSREPLSVSGEATFAVPPLPVPPSGTDTTCASLSRYESARLFAERAAAARPSFRISDENAGAVAAICRRLDGIPLAIELAAARVRGLAVQTIAQRLDDRFHLLKRGDATAMPRQQTLRACIDWSHDLLTDTERALLRRLAVFAGGFVLEAAEDVGSGEPIEPGHIIDLLPRLVERSLVELDADGQRYRLLETIREYAHERLIEAGEEVRVRDRHLAFHVDLALKARDQLSGAGQKAWYARLKSEHENVLAAHSWCDTAVNGAEQGLRLAGATELLWSHTGLLELGRRVAIEALARADAQPRDRVLCEALHAAGNLCFYLGHYAEALRYGEECLAVAREVGHPGQLVSSLVLAGWAAHASGDIDTARRHDEEALAVSRRLAAGGDNRQLLAALNNLGELYRVDGNLPAAAALYEEAVSLAREWGDATNMAVNLLNLAMVSIGQGAAARAVPMLREALGIVDELGARRMARAVLEVLAALSSATERYERAALLYGVAQAQLRQMKLQREPVDEAALAPLIGRARAALGDAGFAAAEAAGGALSFDEALAKARAWLQERSS